MAFVDFAEVKASHPIETLIERLDLKLLQKGEQYRGPCPTCRSGGDRALVITPSKAAYFCFAAQRGGDVIALAAHIRGTNMKDAAHWIAGKGDRSDNRPQAVTVPNERKGNGEHRLLKPLDYLLVEHPALKEFGFSPETLEHFGAGYAPKGIMRGRLAIPIHDWEGELLAYCGQVLSSDQEPALIFPSGFVPETHIFNAHRVRKGELTLLRDPLAVLAAFDAGIENAVCFLTTAPNADQLTLLGQFMVGSACSELAF